MGKYDDLFDAAPSPTPAAEVGKYSDLFDESGVVATQPRDYASEIPSGAELTDIGVQGEKALPVFVRHALDRASHVVPQSWGELGGMAESLFPPIEAFRQTKQGYDIATGTPPQEAVPGITALKDLEDIKNQYGGGSPEYQAAAGNVAGDILPQMVMAALTAHQLQVPTPTGGVRGEPLATPELPPSPNLGPGTIAGDVSRALAEQRVPEVNRQLAPEQPTVPSMAEATEPAPQVREALSLDEIRLQRERGELQTQNDISKQATGQTHPAVDERLDQIDQDLTDIANRELQPAGSPPAPVDIAALQKRKAQIEASIAPSKAIGQRTAYDEELAGIKQKLGEPVAVSATAVGTGKPYRSAALRYFGTEVVEAPSHAQALTASPYASEAGFESGFVTHEGQFVPYTGEIGAVPPKGPVNAPGGAGNASEAPGGVQGAAPGTVRLYHGSSADSPQAGRDFTTDRQYATDYAAKAQGGGEGKVWYVDVPEGVVKTHDEYGQPMTRVVVPDEIANQARPLTPVAEPAAETPRLEVAPEPYTPEAAAQRAAQPEPVPQAFSEEPHVSAIANRFTAERAAAGELGEIAPGESVNTMDLVHHGLKMSPEQVNASVSRVMQGGDVPINDVAALRGEEARLSQRSGDLSRAARANPSPEAQLAADNAFKDLTDFHNGPVAQAKRNWHHQGKLMQGEIPVDLSTLNGMREAWLKDTGKPPPAHVEPKLQRVADNLARAIDEERAAARNGGDAIEKATQGRKMPTPEEVRNNIAERMGVEPCII